MQEYINLNAFSYVLRGNLGLVFCVAGTKEHSGSTLRYAEKGLRKE